MKTVLLIATLLGGGFLVTGCSSPCDELSKVCDKCSDSTVKASCNQTASTYKGIPGGDTSCQAVLDANTYGQCK
jgi:hypothetical protein